VLAIDLSPTLVALARDRSPVDLGAGAATFMVGDFLDPGLGRFDHVVAMDSLIHYTAPGLMRVLGGLVDRTAGSIVFTFAPRTPLLSVMHAVGRAFPRGNRAPMIEPVSEARLRRLLVSEPAFAAWQAGRTSRVARGFYISQALEIGRR